VLEGDDLLQQQHGSLGETLNKQPGVASTWFGPGASRPVIRGLDGDRIRILRNGVGALDASSLSYDHAVPLDPVTVDRVEIVRGPAALLYGGNAIGGVVNTFDNRIPTPIEGIHGAGELRYGGADTTRSSAGKLEAGNGAFALHLDANSRQFNDLRIPGYAAARRCATPTSPAASTAWKTATAARTAARSAVLPLGPRLRRPVLQPLRQQLRLGGRAGVRLDMQQDHYAFASELRDLDGPFSSVKVDAGYTDYEHREIEAAKCTPPSRTKATKRASKPPPAARPGGGVIGAQVSRNEFSALGEEAFVPHTDTDSLALFMLEQWQATERLNLSLGARLEHTRVDPDAKGNETFAAPTAPAASTPSACLPARCTSSTRSGRWPPTWATPSAPRPSTSCTPTAPTSPPAPMKWATPA
jgi:iron complex outermembrane receptor protein